MRYNPWADLVDALQQYNASIDAAMDYKEKCAFIAHHAKGKVMTPEEVDAEIQDALKHPLLFLFMDAESLADATIAQIKKESYEEKTHQDS